MNKKDMRELSACYDAAFESLGKLKRLMDRLLDVQVKATMTTCPRCHKKISTYQGTFNLHRGLKKDGRACAMSYEAVPKAKS